MKALIYTGPKSMVFQDADAPELASGENLIEVRSVGICGSDMHAYLGHDDRRPAPLILGHEAAGVVIAGPMTGKRVTVNPLVTCGTCRYCASGRANLCQSRQIISMQPRQGAFAQQLRMPTQNLIEVPEHVSFDAAALAEPIAVCWHAVRLAEQAMFGDLAQAKCLVLGGGAIGVGSALSLQVKGASDISIVEPNPLRRQALAALPGLTVLEQASGSFDVVIDAVGFDATRETASQLVVAGGVIMHVGLGGGQAGLDIRRVTLQEITFIGTYTYTVQDFIETAQCIFDGGFSSLDWIETRALSDGSAAFDDILAGRVSVPKIVLNP